MKIKAKYVEHRTLRTKVNNATALPNGMKDDWAIWQQKKHYLASRHSHINKAS